MAMEKKQYIENDLSSGIVRSKEETGRELRLSLTQRCNYKCYFCHKEGFVGNEEDLLHANDYALLGKIGKEELGFDSVSVTGGEPLLHNEIGEIMRGLKEQGLKITLITNGFFIKDRIDMFQYVDSINISMHATNEEQYKEVTGVDGFQKVKEGIAFVKKHYPDVSVKLNIALVKGRSDGEEHLKEFMDFAKEMGVGIKFMELFPRTNPEFVPFAELEEKLKKVGFVMREEGVRNKIYENNDMQIKLARIFCAEAQQQLEKLRGEFCHKFNDIFVGPNGDIKICRVGDDKVNVLEELKNNDKQGLVKKFDKVLNDMGRKCCI